MCAARGLDLRAPLCPAPATAAGLAVLRSEVPGPGPDRHLAPELAATEALVASGALVAAAESAVGPWPDLPAPRRRGRAGTMAA